MKAEGKSRTVGRLLCALVALGLIAACSGGSGANTGPNGNTPQALQGVVHGGQAPVTAATVTLYAAGQPALAAATAVATTTSDANGNFNLSFSCSSAPLTPSSLLYATSTSGNAGGGVNGAIHMMAALGQCQSLPRFVDIDEVTTVAAAYALNRFIGGNGCIDCATGALPTGVDNIGGNAPALANAFGMAVLLASPATGSASPPLPSAAVCAAAPSQASLNCGMEQRLNALANSLASCINSAGGSSAQCGELFTCSVPGASYGSGACTVPTGAAIPGNTLQALLSIARNPALVSQAGVYDAATRNPVFSPALSGAPPEWTLSLDFTAGGLSDVSAYATATGGNNGIAIDAAGDVWLAVQTNTDATNDVIELSPAGIALSGGSGFNAGGDPGAIAIDNAGNIWVANNTVSGFANCTGSNNGRPPSNLSKLSASGSLLATYPYGAAMGVTVTSGGVTQSNCVISGIAIDGSGNVWLADNTTGSVFTFNASSAAFSAGFTGGGLSNPSSIAIDASGDAWVANPGNNTISELDPNGTAISPAGGYSTGGPNTPYYLAIDSSGDVWTQNLDFNVSELLPNGAAASPAAGFTTGFSPGTFLSFVDGVAVDGAGNVWQANGVINNTGGTFTGSGGISELSPSGTLLSGASGFGSAASTGHAPAGVAIDASGNVWTLNTYSVTTSGYNGYYATVLIGAAAPTRTPLISAITHGFAP